MFGMDWNDIRDQPRFARYYSRLGGRPAWVWGIAFLIGLLPFLILIALLALLAILVTAIIYLLLATVHEIFSRILGSSPPAIDNDPSDENFRDNFRGGRQNVRVISPHHSE
ncbi:MAG: hypothetical protein WC058_06015 [Phycisphaeraceae bacterium]